jgi:hypothetical protein
MSGNNRLYRYFKRHPLEVRVLDNTKKVVKNIKVDLVVDDIVIETKETTLSELKESDIVTTTQTNVPQKDKKKKNRRTKKNGY